MKTIGKKIKAIYFLAVVAIVSICMAILPMMSTNVKADTKTNDIKVIGAQVIVIDDTTSAQNFDGKYAISFKAEFSKDFYESLIVKNNVVKFGMLVGLADNYANVTSIDTAKANGYVDSCYLGNKGPIQYVSFEPGETTYAYEGTIEFNEADIVADKTTDAEKIDALLEHSSQDLVAIPYYVVNDVVTLEKADEPVTRSARKLINDEYTLSSLEFGNNLYARYVGTFDGEYSGCEYYVEKLTGKVYKADANNQLVPFIAADFVGAGQLVVNVQDATALSLNQFALTQQTMASLTEGEDYSIAVYVDDDANTVRTIKAKVITKILSTKEDFFKDTDGDGVGNIDPANYIFHLDCVKNASDGNYTTKTVIDGYYVLAGNIDFENNGNIVAARGDIRPYATSSVPTGFTATLDGRGFAISNINVANASGGLFGMLHSATIKNIAFNDVTSGRNDENPGILSNWTYNTTFENVYVKLKETSSIDRYISNLRIFGRMNSSYGANVFTNVVYENTAALEEGNTSKHNRPIFDADTTAIYNNTNLIGLPSYFKYAAHATETDKYVLTINISSAAMTAFGVEVGEYKLSDCEVAATALAGLIANLEERFIIDIDYINFVEDTVRGYYVSNASLAADATAAKAYTDTGFWTKVGDEIAWNSLVAESYSVKSNNEDPTDMFFTDSITLEMYKGSEKLENITLRAIQSDLDAYITISGTTITKKPNAVLIKNVEIPIDVIYSVGENTYELTANLTLELDYDKVNVYQSGEFVIETSTGKVFMPNANNELVPYDATNYLADVTKLYYAGVEVEVKNANPFTVDISAVPGLIYGQTQPFVAATAEGPRYLVASTATKVISTLNDFFSDIDADGVGDIATANYIFHLDKQTVSGGHFATTEVTGYYVLANNIDMQNNSSANACAGDARFLMFSAYQEKGFRGTFDGRGFALTNITTGSSGLFGMLNRATIKDVAFVDAVSTHNDGNVGILAYSTYNSTFENVYVRVQGSTANDRYLASPSGAKIFGAINATHGVSTFTNVITENFVALQAGNANKRYRFVFSNDTSSTYNNTTIIGLPSYYTYAKHATDTEKYVLTLYLPSSELTILGVTATEYSLASCPEAVTTAYANLIANLETHFTIDIEYMNFIEDTLRGYYLDNATFAADETATSAYISTGYWGKLGNIIAWKSLIDSENFEVKSNNTDPENMMFEESIELEMYYGSTKLENVVLSIDDKFDTLVEINGNTISKKPSAILTNDTRIPVTLSYSDGVNTYSKTVEITLQIDPSTITPFESGEFIIDKTTGEVFKTNADTNELLPYDATSFAEGMTGIYVAGAETTASSITAFAIDPQAFANLPLNESVTIALVHADGARYLMVKPVTRVLSTLDDFFKDADGSGTVEDAEMIQANYIFNLQVVAASGARNPSVAIEGYYVLANNIDLQKKGALVSSSMGDQTVQIFNTLSDVGFMATLDGRGFALKNGNPSSSSGGMFGAFYGATVKNIAFDGFTSSRNDGSVVILGYAYNSTFENVYIRVVGNTGNDSYLGSNGSLTVFGINDNLKGASTFTNVVLESMDGLVADATNDHTRINFTFHSHNARGTYTNTAIIGMPVTFNYAAHSTDTSKHVLSLTMSAAAMTQLGVEAGEIALESCPTAVTTAYGNLIANLETKVSIDIAYVNFVEDTKEGRAYYLNNASLVADTTTTKAYTDTGMWINLGGELLWKSLVGEDKLTLKTSAEEGKFVDSTTVDMYYGETKLEGVELSVSEEDAKLVEISGNTITRKTNAQVLADEVITVTATCNGVSVTIDLTLLYDLDSVVVYEEGEVVIEQSTGKVFKANANNQLLAYDATSYLAGAEKVVIAGEEVVVANASEFALGTSDIEALTVGNEYLMTAGENAFIAKIVTKVLSTVSDFFNDANGDGTVASDEMTRDNYIFNLQPVGSSGAGIPSIAIKGYYVLANNIDLNNNSTLCNRSSTSGDHTVQIWSASDVGFRGTLDGRGFALKNGSPSGSSAGMFGAFYGATIKNIAFDGFTNTAGNGTGLILGYSYNSTFENVYIRLVGNNNGDNYGAEGNSWTAIYVNDTHGVSTFTNTVVESMDGLVEGNTNKHQRFTFTKSTGGTFTNTSIVGMPVTFSYAAHATATDKYVLSLTMSASAMTKLGVTAGEVQLSALSTTATTAYAGLISNLETRRSIDIDYINFVEDTKAGRGYYLDSAALSADTTAVNAYVTTGYWKVVDNALTWASLA